jgi:hypothetical protein
MSDGWDRVSFISNDDSVTITLPNPEKGNSDVLLNNIIKRRDYNGNIHTYTRPTEHRITLDFIALPRYKFENIREFIISNVGLTFTYEDQNDIQKQVKFSDETISLATEEYGGVFDNDKKEELCNFQINLVVQE